MGSPLLQRTPTSGHAQDQGYAPSQAEELPQGKLTDAVFGFASSLVGSTVIPTQIHTVHSDEDPLKNKWP